jgi:hypothetical protein
MLSYVSRALPLASNQIAGPHRVENIRGAIQPILGGFQLRSLTSRLSQKSDFIRPDQGQWRGDVYARVTYACS